jgi:hypothetical protein
LQNWHLYFFSGADTAFRGVEVEVDGSEVAVAISADAAGMTAAISSYSVASMYKGPPATHKPSLSSEMVQRFYCCSCRR